MKSLSVVWQHLSRVVRAGLIVWLLVWMVAPAEAQTVRIRFRPLTPQEIKNAGLTNTTQKSTGAPNAGLGQPVYFEALVQTGKIVNAINWSIISAPAGSTNVITDGPLSNAVPTYDGGDRNGYFVGGRAMFKPDIVSSFDFDMSTIIDYKIRTEVILDTGTFILTNSVYGSKFIGQNHYLCVLCHADKQTNFNQTAHATAFTEQITGAGSDHFSSKCISCHTLGYDTTPGAVNDGFDDIATAVGWTFPTNLVEANWTSMPSNLQNKANVQCESCHGAASAHMVSLGNTNAIDITLSSGTCGTCHDSLPQHVKTFEWAGSLHSTGYVFRFSGSCVPCHSSVGFIETWDPYYAPLTKTPRATSQEGIACAACHDPHTVGMGEHQLRAITTATLSNGVVITESVAGTGVLCMNCHHSRQSAAISVAGTGSISPHHSTQADMLAGENAFEYGMDMPSSKHMTAVTNSCVGCHMQLIAQTTFSNSNTKVGGHTFKISWDNGTPGDEMDDVKVTEVCKTCHVGLYNTFDFGGEDYDRDGTVEGVQTEIQGLLETLGILLPPLGSTSVVYNSSFTPAQRKATFNWLYVWEDKSLGVHNPKYAAAILQASIDDISGGIDVDNDGLIDSWEQLYFGNLTSQTGSGDADNDGVSNRLEMQAGTNPNLADTDNDTFTDLAEMQGGSDPLSNLSILDTNVVTILPAIELEYLPSTVGVTQRFEYIDAMADHGWTNIGASFISTNAQAYQLMSLRDPTQKYFRVIKP